jgi:hypothetical protein
MKAYYVGLDVHKASICIAVLNADGKSRAGGHRNCNAAGRGEVFS